MGVDAILRFYDLCLPDLKNQWGDRLSKFPIMVRKEFFLKKKQEACKIIEKWFLPCDSVFKLEGYKTALKSSLAARTSLAFEEVECGRSCYVDVVIQFNTYHSQLTSD